jgi:glycosyltransferase involved in cell wall biosynthesis
MVRGVRHADVAVAQSTSMAADLLASGVDERRIRTIANPIDGGWVDARTAEGPPTPLRGAPRLLAVGRLERQKGFDVLVRALPAVRAAHPEAHVTVLGDGGQRGDLEALARELGVADAITFAGNDPNPFRAYAGADLLVAPSRWEGLSNTMLEALAAGLPVVGADGAAAGQDLITAPELGRLVHPEDVDGLAAAVLDALAADFDRAHIAATTREHFATATIVDAYADLLLEAAARGATGRGRAGR